MNQNNNQTEQKLAGSLTAETTELLPYLPYLLQDIWELGSSPRDMALLIRNHIPVTDETRILDLGCGKGAVSVALCKEFGIRARGIDLFSEFIETAGSKAREYGVEHLCEFMVQDINESVETEHGYDIVILGAVGDVLGEPALTLKKLRQAVSPKGFILIDEAYLTGSQDDVRYQNYEYLTFGQWEELFRELGLELTAYLTAEDGDAMDEINDYNNMMIRKRADELDDVVAGVTWLLKRL